MPIAVTETVRRAQEELGDVPPEELAAYIAANFGMTNRSQLIFHARDAQ